MKINPAIKPEPIPELDTPTAAPSGPLVRWCLRHPALAIVLMAALAVIINNYPIIFCGRSYVSPSARLPMLHDGGATFPDLHTLAGNDHGSDSAAVLLWGVPAGFIESRALMEHGELPLWNRYSHAGDTFIGQAVSMLGDPLQLIVIFGHGSAIAWDFKYLLAKLIFCVGFGLLVLRLLGSQLLSLLFTVLAAYCGAFFYIDNHPVFFVFSYAPWILLSALEFLDLQSTQRIRWGLIWLVANIGCFNGGHVEPAVTLIGGLNLAAVVYWLAHCRNVADSAKILTRMAVVTLLFLGLTAPVWLSFLVSLPDSYSAHSQVQVTQLPPAALLGAFDDVFYRLPLTTDWFEAPAPGASLLIAVGSLFSAFRWRQLKSDPFFVINSCAIVLWSACIFKIIPGWVLAVVPLFNRIGHIYKDFSYLLVLHLTIQCAYGFKALAQESNLRRGAVDFLRAALILVVITLVFCFEIPHSPVPWSYFLCVAVAAFAAPLLYLFLKLRHGRISALWWVAIIILGFIPNFRFGLYHTGNERALMLPGRRIVLNEPSESIDKIRADPSGPFRVVGLQRNLFGDYSAVYGLEDIRSCAPLSNTEFMYLLQNFPGMRVTSVWMARVLDPWAAQPLLNLLNVKYLLCSPLVPEKMFDSGPFRIADRGDFIALENPDAWPRAFFSDKIIPLSSLEEFVGYLAVNGKQPFAALTPEEIAKQPGLSQLQGTKPAAVVPAKNYKLGINSTAFDIHATSSGIVCLTEGQAKDFTASANGTPRDVLAVNGAFKGIYLGAPGDYHIKFIFRPRHWREACILFWTAAALVLILLAVQFAGHQLKRPQSRPSVQVV